MKNRILVLAISSVLTASLFAGAKSFDMKDPTGESNVAFELDAPLEHIEGSANGFTGEVKFDARNPAATTGHVILDTSSIMVPKSKMRDHIMAPMWMNVGKFPEARYDIKGLAEVDVDSDGTVSGIAKGTMTVKGVIVDLDANVKIRVVKDALGKMVSGKEGDLLVVQGDFILKRDSHNINKGNKLDKVANDINVSLNLVGFHYTDS